jgi:hypothetical protein
MKRNDRNITFPIFKAHSRTICKKQFVAVFQKGGSLLKWEGEGPSYISFIEIENAWMKITTRWGQM